MDQMIGISMLVFFFFVSGFYLLGWVFERHEVKRNIGALFFLIGIIISISVLPEGNSALPVWVVMVFGMTGITFGASIYWFGTVLNHYRTRS